MTGDFNAKSFAIRIMRAKGYDPEASDEWAKLLAEQWPGWKKLFEQYRFYHDPEFAETMFTAFLLREVKGGAGKVLESFTASIEARPKQGGSPALEFSGKDWGDCAFCDGRGIVSEIPSQQDPSRRYSWACVCGRGKLFGTLKQAPDYALDYAEARKKAEIARYDATLAEFGIDPKADPQTRARQFREAVRSMRAQVGAGKASAKHVRPIPRTVDEARAMMAKRPRKLAPPPHLDPEAVALKVLNNGDERNEDR